MPSPSSLVHFALRRPSLALLSVAALLALPMGAFGQETPAPPVRPPVSSPSEAIDYYLDAALKSTGATPAAEASPEVLLRRTTLDLVGRVPTPYERRVYLADPSPHRRQHMVERLMASPEYVEHQADAYNDLLMGFNNGSLHAYLKTALAQNRPWDGIFQDLVLSQEKNAAPFLKSRVKDHDKLTNDVSVIFFGLNISCAKCHTHPFVTDWTQDRFYGMKSFFNRTFEHGDWVGEQSFGNVDFKTPAGESKTAALMFFTGALIDEPESKPLDNKAKKAWKAKLEQLKKKKEPAPAPSFSRRAALIDVALRSENQPFLARAIVNQLWKRHFGTGLVDPVDQMHPENPPVLPELLDWLSQDMIREGFDLRRLTQAIVMSEAYGRSSSWEPPSEDVARPSRHLFAVAELRPLTPMQYAMSLRIGATRPEYFEAKNEQEHSQKVLQLRNSAKGLARNFDPVVGDDFQISVTEALWMSNSKQAADQLLQDRKESIIQHLAELDSPQAQAEAAHLQVVGVPGPPSAIATIVDFLETGPDDEQARRQRLTHVTWSLLSSAGCRFNY